MAASIRKSRFWKQDRHFDDFGVRNPAMQKRNQLKFCYLYRKTYRCAVLFMFFMAVLSSSHTRPATSHVFSLFAPPFFPVGLKTSCQLLSPGFQVVRETIHSPPFPLRIAVFGPSVAILCIKPYTYTTRVYIHTYADFRFHSSGFKMLDG